MSYGDPQDEPQIDLRDKFPELEPIGSVPGLGTLNGCGFGLYGSRNYDDETGTYVTSYAFCLVFIPILFLRAYRVAAAGGDSYYFIGREPLSSVARGWNVFLVLAIAAFTGTMIWSSHTSSPDYIAANKVAEADALLAEGRLLQAGSLYADVARGPNASAGEATAKFRELFAGDLGGISGAQALQLLNLAIAMQNSGRLGSREELYERGQQIGEQVSQQDFNDALAVFDTLTPLAPDPAAHAALREPLLEKAVAAQPGDVRLLSELALILESREETERCKQLLEPQREQLAGHEGARILGQIYSREDRFDDAHSLLRPYVDSRLEKLHAAEQAYEARMLAAQNRFSRSCRTAPRRRAGTSVTRSPARPSRTRWSPATSTNGCKPAAI